MRNSKGHHVAQRNSLAEKIKTARIHQAPISYKKPLFQSAAFYALAVVTTMIAVGVFYYG